MAEVEGGQPLAHLVSRGPRLLYLQESVPAAFSALPDLTPPTSNRRVVRLRQEALRHVRGVQGPPVPRPRAHGRLTRAALIHAPLPQLSYGRARQQSLPLPRTLRH